MNENAPPPSLPFSRGPHLANDALPRLRREADLREGGSEAVAGEAEFTSPHFKKGGGGQGGSPSSFFLGYGGGGDSLLPLCPNIYLGRGAGRGPQHVADALSDAGGDMAHAIIHLC